MVATHTQDQPLAGLRAALAGERLLGFDMAAWGEGDPAAAKPAFVGYNNFYTVTNTADSGAGSLRDAITQSNNAASSSSISFAPSLAGQTITLQSTLTITAGNTNIFGQGITVSGNNSVGVFTIDNGNTGPQTRIEGLTIANGKGTGTTGSAGMFGTAQSPNGGPGVAGGDAAGGIYVRSGNLSAQNVTFTNNTATGGQGGDGGPAANSGTKGAGGAGGNAAGAVYVAPGASVTASNLIFSGNTATAGAGGIGSPAGQSGTASEISNSPTVRDAAVCFTSGTRILTERGTVAVEDLAVGDTAVTARGAHRPIRWIGSRLTDTRRHSDPTTVLPVRICAGALGDNRPVRDLVVSPGHAICLDVLGEVLIPAGALVNGSTIVQEHVDSVTYWHVELDSHDILLAENLPAESYLEAGDRSFFRESPPSPAVGTADGSRCRPFKADGDLVDLVRERLSERAELLGWRRSADMDIHLMIDGVRVDPVRADGLVRFLVPAEAEDVRLMSAWFHPSWMRDSDNRRLGIAVSGIRISDGLLLNREIAPSDERLADGFYAVEIKEQWSWRWMTGCARLPRDLWAGAAGEVFLAVAFNPSASQRWIEPAARLDEKAEASEIVDNVVRLRA